MVDAARHPKITLLTYAQVQEVSGYIGNFQVKVRRRPRYVDVDKCTACGECAAACVLRGKTDDEFQLGLGKRAAIYMPFAEAVPSIYVVDSGHCLLLQQGKCGESPVCVDACPEDAIQFVLEGEIVVEGVLVAVLKIDHLRLARIEQNRELDPVGLIRRGPDHAPGLIREYDLVLPEW